MIDKIEDILDIEVVWDEEIPGGVEFFSTVEGDLCQLRMNDFPDEPLYTLVWKEFSLDIDDAPSRWTFR